MQVVERLHLQRCERGSSLERLGDFSRRHVAQVVISEVKCRESLVAFEGLSNRLAAFTFQAVPIQVQLLNRRIAPQHFRNRGASAGPWTIPELSAPRHICNKNFNTESALEHLCTDAVASEVDSGNVAVQGQSMRDARGAHAIDVVVAKAKGLERRSLCDKV